VNVETNAALDEPEVRSWLKQNNVVRGATTPDGFRQFISSEIKKLAQIGAKAGISVE
jgi:tripartite-type tricarboxylate transporter receptor subunit TctC